MRDEGHENVTVTSYAIMFPVAVTVDWNVPSEDTRFPVIRTDAVVSTPTEAATELIVFPEITTALLLNGTHTPIARDLIKFPETRTDGVSPCTNTGLEVVKLS